MKVHLLVHQEPYECGNILKAFASLEAAEAERLKLLEEHGVRHTYTDMYGRTYTYLEPTPFSTATRLFTYLPTDLYIETHEIEGTP
jgi:hypothetical protein